MPRPITLAARQHVHNQFLNLQYLTETAAIRKDDIDVHRKFQTPNEGVHFVRLCSLRTSCGKEYELKCCTYPAGTHASTYRLIIDDKVIATHPRGFHQGFIIELLRMAVRCDARVVHVRQEVIELDKGRIVRMWMCIACLEWHFDEHNTHWPHAWCLLYQPGGPGGRLLEEFLSHRPPPQ